MEKQSGGACLRLLVRVSFCFQLTARPNRPTHPTPPAEAGNRGDPLLIRTFAALQRTRLHLLRVMDSPDHSLHARQMFLWDRYRALRKDMNQQALGAQGRAQLAWSVTAVEEVVRFLLLVDAVLMGEDKVRLESVGVGWTWLELVNWNDRQRTAADSHKQAHWNTHMHTRLLHLHPGR
jgi:hypothetical protein